MVDVHEGSHLPLVGLYSNFCMPPFENMALISCLFISVHSRRVPLAATSYDGRGRGFGGGGEFGSEACMNLKREIQGNLLASMSVSTIGYLILLGGRSNGPPLPALRLINESSLMEQKVPCRC